MSQNNHLSYHVLRNKKAIWPGIQWCSRDRNLRDRDLSQISRWDRDWDFVIKAETETWKSETETRDLTFIWW